MILLGEAKELRENVIKKLMTSMKCDSCGRHYDEYDVDVIGHRQDMWFLRVFCPECNTHCLVAAVVREGKASEQPQRGYEITSGEHREAVSADDVLSMHLFLKNFEGDFSHLFGRE